MSLRPKKITNKKKTKSLPKQRRQSKTRSIPARTKEFLKSANLEIHEFNGKVMGVGLMWGDGTRMRKLGFSRKESIKILNWLEKNTWALE